MDYKRPLPACPAGEGDFVASSRAKDEADPCHLVWQVNQIRRLASEFNCPQFHNDRVRICFTCRASRQGSCRISPERV